MALQVRWDNEEKTILVYEFAVGWTWKDFDAALAVAQDMLDSVNHPVGVIFYPDSPQVKVPRDFLLQATKYLQQRHVNTIILVLVVKNSFVKTMFGLLERISVTSNITLTTARSLSEARLTIHNQQPQIS